MDEPVAVFAVLLGIGMFIVLLPVFWAIVVLAVDAWNARRTNDPWTR